MGTAVETTVCPLCSGTKTSPLVVGYDRSRPTPDEFPYVRCRDCGLARQDPLPAEEEISGFYPDDYEPHTSHEKRHRDRWINRMATRYYYGTQSVEKPRLAKLPFRILSGRIMRQIYPPRGANRMLDVGCAKGDLLDRYRSLGWNTRGIEVSPNACELARGRGLDVHRGTVFDAAFEPRSFDLIVLSHVIEHVLDPIGVLETCARWLAPGGLLSLSTPNLNAFGFRVYGSCWFPLDAPRHLILFNPHTIRLLGKKSGLHAEKLVTRPEPDLLCASRHIARNQGRDLPPDIAARTRVVEQAQRTRASYPLFRGVLRPVIGLGAMLGRGETLEVDFVPRVGP